MPRSVFGKGLGHVLLGTKPASPTTRGGRAVIARPLAELVTPDRISIVTRSGHTPAAAASGLVSALRQPLSEPAALR